jgi:plastocyanin
MSVRCMLAISVLALAACDDGGDGTGTPDAPRIDAQVSNVMAVTCPATTSVTFTTLAERFEPTTASITRGQIVKFESTNSTHPIEPIPNNPLSDPGLVVPAGSTKCFTFLSAGMYKFQCTVHGYPGTLTVN